MDVPLNQRSRSELRQLRLLGAIVSIGSTSTSGAVLDVELAAHPSVDDDLAVVRDELIALRLKKLVTLDERLLGPVYATISGLGIAEWSAFASQRSNVIARRMELRDEYLRWLYEDDGAQRNSPVLLIEAPQVAGLD